MAKPAFLKSPAVKSAKAAKAFSRRLLLRRAASLAGATAMGPWVVKDALSSSGRLNVICWTGYLPDQFLADFEESTGIRVYYTPLGSNEELLNKIKATRGYGFDLVTPTLDRKGQWAFLKLLQPWDLSKIDTSRVEKAFLDASASWTWEGGQYHLPHVWGTEALAWRTDLWSSVYGKASLGDLWLEEMKGKVQGRPHSMMAGIGRYLAERGKLPPFEDSYVNEEAMRRTWEEITKFAVAHKPWIKAFWNDHDTQKNNFMKNGCVIGQTWDGPALELSKAGEPVTYMAPKEGAFAWLDGLSLPIRAENLEQAYEFVNALYQLETAVLTSTVGGYNTVIEGVSKYLDRDTKRVFEEAYPGDALSKLWWWPTTPQWYADLRSEYRNKFVAS